MIDALNKINENVWAVVLIVLGGTLAIIGHANHDLIGAGLTIIGFGGAAFKGGKTQPAQ